MCMWWIVVGTWNSREALTIKYIASNLESNQRDCLQAKLKIWWARDSDEKLSPAAHERQRHVCKGFGSALFSTIVSVRDLEKSAFL